MLAVVTFLGIALGYWLLAGVTVGTMMYSRQQAKSTASKQRKKQEAAAKAQAEAAGRQRAIQQAPISAGQMEMVMGAEKIESLLDKFDEQDHTEQVIYTLPTAEPTSPVERINRAISDFFR